MGIIPLVIVRVLEKSEEFLATLKVAGLMSEDKGKTKFQVIIYLMRIVEWKI